VKDVVVLSNHPHGQQLRYDRIAEPEHFRLHVITSELGATRMRRAADRADLAGLYVVPEFSLHTLSAVVDGAIRPGTAALEFVTNHESVVSVCGRLRQRYGVSASDYERFTNKDAMKERLRRGGIRFPRYVLFDKTRYAAEGARYLDELLCQVDFPLFVKPLDAAGSVGTGKIEARVDFDAWATAAIESPYEFEVDEFIDGTLYHCETLLKHGQILYTQVCEYSRPCFDFTLGAPLGSITLPSDHADAVALRRFADDVHRELADDISGVTHLEVFKDHRGDLVFVEIAYRTPGVLASEMYEKSLGLSLPEYHIRLQTSAAMRLEFQAQAYAARFIYPRVAGVVTDFVAADIASAHEFQWRIATGDTLAKSERISQLAGTMLLWNADFAQLHADFRSLANRVPYRVTPPCQLERDTFLG